MALKRALSPIAEQRQSVPCAHDICERTAILRHKLKSGWANLCLGHYDMHTLEEAKAFCKAQGLHNVTDMRAWMKGKRIGGVSPHEHWTNVLRDPHAPLQARQAAVDFFGPPPERVPGQDDEERAA